MAMSVACTYQLCHVWPKNTPKVDEYAIKRYVRNLPLHPGDMLFIMGSLMDGETMTFDRR